MKKVDLDQLRAYFDRVSPFIPELFNIAYAICGTEEAAEYALMYALMDVWMSEARGGIGMREGLRNAVREVALEEALDREDELAWDGGELAANPELAPLNRANAQTCRLVVLRSGCNLGFSVIAKLMDVSAADAKREFNRFKCEWAKRANIPEHGAEAALSKRVRRQMSAASRLQPSTEALYRSLTEEALQTARPKRLAGRILRRIAEGIVIALCAFLFWLIGVLIG